ncbi:hypothetical protein SBA2_200024 [Acidobacteriia bacterium SbA2]|nr:hypothetical protein SBA2_200024 [Acidobacteriia bacterium SbA2]
MGNGSEPNTNTSAEENNGTKNRNWRNGKQKN